MTVFRNVLHVFAEELG